MNEAMKEINDEIKKVKEETNTDFEIEVTETTDEPVEFGLLSINEMMIVFGYFYY